MPWIISSCSSLLIVAVRIRLAAVGQWKQSHTELKFEFKSKFSFKSKSKSVPESHFRAAEEAKRPTRQTQVPNRVYLRYKISAVQWRPSRWRRGGGRLPHKSPNIGAPATRWLCSQSELSFLGHELPGSDCHVTGHKIQLMNTWIRMRIHWATRLEYECVCYIYSYFGKLSCEYAFIYMRFSFGCLLKYI